MPELVVEVCRAPTRRRHDRAGHGVSERGRHPRRLHRVAVVRVQGPAAALSGRDVGVGDEPQDCLAHLGIQGAFETAEHEMRPPGVGRAGLPGRQPHEAAGDQRRRDAAPRRAVRPPRAAYAARATDDLATARAARRI
ncbi:MAG: hypothetical protein V9F04_12970 [Dermatophilaceae bacterium]